MLNNFRREEAGASQADEIETLMREANSLGILNIDVCNDKLSPEVIRAAIRATKELNAKLDKNMIAQNLRDGEKSDASRV